MNVVFRTMYAKQIIVLLAVGYGILGPDNIFGFEIISTTTERDVNKDGRCQQAIIQTLENNLQQRQNFWIRREQLFEKKMEETSAEFEKKQKEVIETINKQNNLLQQVDQKIKKMSEQPFDEKLEKANDEFGKKQNELIKHFDEKIEELETKLVNIQQEFLKQFKKEIENVGTVVHGNNDNNNNDLLQVKTSLPKNCAEILKRGDKLSGVYTIQPINTSFEVWCEVWCDMDTRGGGWTYVLNRFDGSQDFYLDWAHYKNGFGNLRGEFWLGLQHLYELTGFQDNQMLIEIVDWDNNKHFYLMYTMFRIGSEEEGYPINVLSGYSGDTGDVLQHSKNMRFTTYDRDQDDWMMGNYAKDYFHGAWWYSSDGSNNLAGNYFSNTWLNQVFIYLHHNRIRLKKVKMMVRPNSLQ